MGHRHTPRGGDAHGPRRPHHRLEFSPDDRLLATASFDGTARLWDPVTGDQVASLGGHARRVLDVAFSPDGTYLATSGHDDTVFIRHLVLTPEDACTLVADEVTASRLGEALGHRTPSACTDLR